MCVKPWKPVHWLMTCCRFLKRCTWMRFLLSCGEGALQLAVVLDEYGGTSGIVLLKTLLKKLWARYPMSTIKGERNGLYVLVTATGCSQVCVARMRLTNLFPGVIAEHPSYETVGGFMMEQLGRHT